MKVLETERLNIRWFQEDDAAFILELLNSPGWVEFIGDRGIRTTEEARDYIINVLIDMYQRLGFGLYAVELKDSLTPIGMCGLIKRDSLEDVDIGYALLPSFWGQGFAFEAANAVLLYGRAQLNLSRIVAITSIHNESSTKLLEKLGFQFEQVIKNDDEELKLFASELT